MPHCLQGTDIRGILKAVAQVGRDERPADGRAAERVVPAQVEPGDLGID